MSTIINGTKVFLYAFWIAFILSIFSMLPAEFNSIMFYLGLIMLGIHVLEYVVIKFVMSKDIGFIQTLIFGFGHWLPLMKK